jgi:hypothetical protein
LLIIVLTWIAVVKKLRGTWNWNFLWALVFLAAGTLLMWIQIAPFRVGPDSVIIAAGLLAPSVIVGAIGGGIHYVLRPKLARR